MKFLTVTALILSWFMETTADNFKVVGPDASLLVKVGEDLVLSCSLQPNISAVDMTVEWIRTDLSQSNRLVHLYEDYKDRNDQQMESYRGRTALFKEELKRGNTSLKLSAIQPSDEGFYQCSVEDPSTSWYEDTTVHVEVTGRGLHAWNIAIICVSVAVVLLAAFTLWIVKDRRSQKQLSPAECSVVAFLHCHSEKVRKELNLKKYSTSEEGYQRLIPAISNCRTAPFAGCKLSEQSITTLTAALQSENCSLRELDLSNNDLQDSGVKKISEGLKSPHCKLETLRLVLCKISNGSCDTLSSVLQSENCSLRELDLSNNDLQDSGVEKISEGLKSPHCKLETLRLVLCKISNASCETLSSALQSENCSLRELDLSKNDMRDSGVEKISEGLKSTHCKLKTLRLALCDLGGKSCETLSSALQSEASSLKELDLSNNDLQDSGVEKISEGLKSPHCKLETLRLSGCMITEEGCSFLAVALKSNPSHLKELDLTYNHPGEAGEKLLSDPLCSLHTLRMENSGKKWIKPSLRKYACDVTLDPNTAFVGVSLSEGNRKVERVEEDQSYPDRPERFDCFGQVLSVESWTGLCYWEVEWSGWMAEILVSYRRIQRKGYRDECRFGHNKNSWSLRCSGNSFSVFHNNQETKIPAPPSPSNRVGVYLDWEGGTLSFYTIPPNTHTLTHLHTFTTTFTEPLYAGFTVWEGSSARVCVCVRIAYCLTHTGLW
ncbi:ribonuclease inhibitor-like isoform X2 [Hoplias malabaricus]